MNFLQMVQFVQGNIGTSADLPFAGPSTLTPATGQYLEFKNYVQQAYKTIQLDQDNWRWRIKKAQLTLLAGQNTYSVPQIQQQIPDYEEIIPFHFIDDTQYVNVAQNQAAPVSTATVGSPSSNVGTWYVTVANISTYSVFDPVFVTDGSGNHLSGEVQSVNGSILGFDAASAIIVGDPSVIPPGSAVSYIGIFNPPNVGSDTFCFYIPYQDWRGWKDRNVIPKGKPTYFTRDNDGSLEFTPIPDTNSSPFVVFTDYRMAIDVLISNTSTPATLPSRYHEVICWRAIMYWALVRGKPDKYTAAQLEYSRIMNKMYSEQLPQVDFFLRELYG